MMKMGFKKVRMVYIALLSQEKSLRGGSMSLY